MNDQERIKQFAIQHAPKLAEDITRLCGQVIAKGLQGHLELACEMQDRITQLETELQLIVNANGATAEHLQAIARKALNNK